MSKKVKIERNVEMEFSRQDGSLNLYEFKCPNCKDDLYQNFDSEYSFNDKRRCSCDLFWHVSLIAEAS